MKQNETNTFTARSQLATITANGPLPLASFTYDAAGRRAEGGGEPPHSKRFAWCYGHRYREAFGLRVLQHRSRRASVGVPVGVQTLVCPRAR